MSVVFCSKCQNIINNLFDKSRYEPGEDLNGKELPNILEQEFHLLDSYRDIISAPEDCGLCAFIKKAVLNDSGKDEAGNPKLPDLDREYSMRMRVTGGNKLRPASRDTGLQLHKVAVGTALDIGLNANFSNMLVHFLITAEPGMMG